MIIKKNKICLCVALATLIMVGALVSPQASALSKAERMTKSANNKIENLEAQLRATQDMAKAANSKAEGLDAQLRGIQDDMARFRTQVSVTSPTTAVDSQKIQELDTWMTSVKSEPVKSKNNMFYFRGGFARNDQVMEASIVTNSQQNGWNFGSGIDLSLNDDLFGLMDNTELLGETDLDYVNLGNFTGVSTGTPIQSTQSMLRITASPKIKFLKGSKIRPWIIPVGFTLTVLSPAEMAGGTELQPGLNFGGGVDYNFWKNFYIGTDVRYNLATGKLGVTNPNGLTAGGYIGLGF